MSWLVKSVCTDVQNLVLPVDPYGGCPGARIRKIRSGDPLPYHNIEQMGYQQRDAYPLYDRVRGKTWIVATFDYLPFNRFNLFNGTDGYDVYHLQDGWAAIANTSDGGGYGQTFYGNGCTIGGGWAVFPSADFLKDGTAAIPIADTYWEQTGQSYPGPCPNHYSTDTLTSWKYQAGFQFGGINGNSSKTMDTVISYHGFRPGERFLRHGHLEIFYHTREYGIIRWEVWTPSQQSPTPTKECNGPGTQTYQGVSFVVQFCHDWSRVTLASAPTLPVWPIPNINLLAKPHFDAAIAPVWSSEGKSAAGNPIRWSVQNSTTNPDTRASAIGVRYLRLDCDGGSGRGCGDGLAEAMYQDVPVSKFGEGGDYAFGINARTESDQGSIVVAVQQINRDGEVISTDSTAGAIILPDNGDAGHKSAGEANSVYLSSAFIYNTVKITPRANTTAIRFLILPKSPQIFDVLDAWLAAWPAPAGFGARR